MHMLATSNCIWESVQAQLDKVIAVHLHWPLTVQRRWLKPLLSNYTFAGFLLIVANFWTAARCFVLIMEV